MNIKLISKKSFDKKSVKTIKTLVKTANFLLSKWHIPLAKNLEFYDNLDLFIKRILSDVKRYGLTKEQAIEFIKASLNYGSYGTFDIKKNTIIEFNLNPYFNGFYPSIQFLRLLIHESLHLFLYSKLNKKIYPDKFKFKNGEYCGEEHIIQLDEGFAEFFTETILKGFDYDKIKSLPIYTSMNSPPKFKNKIGNIKMITFNKNFDRIYEKNKNKGWKRIKKEYNKIKGNKNIKIKRIIETINKEV